MTAEEREGGPDAGLSLIELIIYVLLVALVLVGVAMILANSWRTQQGVLSETEATTRGQLVSSSIERAVRNALAVEVAGNTLRVHTSLGASRACQGFDLSGGDATMRQAAGALGTDWPLWQENISAIPGQDLLFQDGSTVTYAFEIQTDASPVRFIGTVSARNPTGVTSPCW